MLSDLDVRPDLLSLLEKKVEAIFQPTGRKKGLSKQDPDKTDIKTDSS